LLHSPFIFHYTATTAIYTLSLHDALPISGEFRIALAPPPQAFQRACRSRKNGLASPPSFQVFGEGLRRIVAPRRLLAQALQANRSEEHTSELQSLAYLVCRLLLEKKKQKK